MEKPLWKESHLALQETMRQEIGAMREILSNLHKEELSLASNDKESGNQLMQERLKLLDHLGYLREARLQAMQKLEQLANSDGKLEQLLPPEDENSCETLLLRDQMMALADKMNLQINRNKLLTNIGHHSSHLNLQPQAKKKKISVATLPRED